MKSSPSVIEAVETAVPLFENSYLEEQEGNDESSTSSSSNAANDKEQNSERLPFIEIFSTGMAFGVLYACIEARVSLYGGRNLHGYGEFDDTMNKIRSVMLWIGSHLGDLFYLILCLFTVKTLTTRGSKAIRSFLEESFGLVWTARSVFVATVLFEGGFLIGSCCMGLTIQYLMGVPLSLIPFALALSLMTIISFLLVRGFDWAMSGAPRREKVGETDLSEQLLQEEEEGDEEAQSLPRGLYIPVL